MYWLWIFVLYEVLGKCGFLFLKESNWSYPISEKTAIHTVTNTKSIRSILSWNKSELLYCVAINFGLTMLGLGSCFVNVTNHFHECFCPRDNRILCFKHLIFKQMNKAPGSSNLIKFDLHDSVGIVLIYKTRSIKDKIQYASFLHSCFLTKSVVLFGKEGCKPIVNGVCLHCFAFVFEVMVGAELHSFIHCLIRIGKGILTPFYVLFNSLLVV